MKKIYSLSAAMMLAIMPAFAQPTIKEVAPHRVPTGFQSCTITPPANDAATMFNAPQQADENRSILLEYCDKQPYSAIHISNGDCGLAACFPADFLAPYQGAQISAINVYAPYNQTKSTQTAQVNTLTECTVFVTEQLGGTPLAETKGTLSTQAFSINQIALETPITIEAGKTLYIGVMFNKVTQADYPFVVDGMEVASSNACWIYSKFKGFSNQGQILLQDQCEWKNLTQQFGTNVSISATVTGDNLPIDCGYIVKDNKNGVVEPNFPFTYVVGFFNKGANAIKTVDIELTIGDQEPQTVTANVVALDGSNTPVTFDDMGVAYGEFICTKEGANIPYTAKLTKINGQPNPMADKTYSGYLVCLKDGYPVNVVMEELTSTTCMYCPMGITGMEMTKEKYPDRFIPIAVHCPIPTAGDPMDVIKQGEEYYNFIVELSQVQSQLGAPSAYANRHFETTITPYPDPLDQEMQAWLSIISFAKVEATLTPTDDPNKVTMKVTTTSKIDEKSPYGIAYSIVEDQVGPYKQYNGFAGQNGNYYGWQSKPKYVSMEFNDVARKGSVYYPIPASTITEFKANEPVEFSTTVDVSAVTKKENYRVVAMLINKTRNYIDNACVVPSPQQHVGVEDVVTEADAPVAMGLKGAIRMMNAGNIYTLDGRMVAAGVEGIVNVPAGLYIAVTTQGAAKVMVR